MTDNKSAFAVNRYDENVRKVIPFYDEIYEQIFSVIQAHCGSKPLAVLDTGCGTGTLGQMALERLNLSELVLCDPSEKMLADAREKLNDQPCEFFICFENTAPFTECGVNNMLKRLEDFEIKAGRTPEEVKSHSARYNREFFPITITEHLDLLRQTGFSVAELFWHSYMQSGFYAVKKV